jgi:hypothetical protein
MTEREPMDAAELESRIASRRDAIAALERVVYARPVDGSDPRAVHEAASRLASLHSQQADDERRIADLMTAETTRAQADLSPESADQPPLDEESERRPRRMRSLLARWGGTAIALVAVAGFVVTAFVLDATRDSLEVFDRVQTDAELIVGNQVTAFDGLPETLRLLDDRDGWKAYGYKNVEGQVCLYIITGSLRSGTCASPSDFRDEGLGLIGSDFEFDEETDSWRALVFTWGPTGDLAGAVQAIDTSRGQGERQGV